MRKLAIWAAGALLTLGATMAQAGGITVTAVTTPGIAPGGVGFDVVRFYAKLVPDVTAGDPFFGATGMQSIDATMTSTGKFQFGFADQNADGLKDWDPTGQFTANDAAARNNNTGTSTSFIRPGDPTGGGGSVFAATIEPAQIFTQDNDFDGNPDPGTDPQVNYGNIKQFRVAAVLQGGKDVKAVSDPLGALIAKAFVPSGSTVTLTGSVAADAGPIVSFTASSGVPEPAALSFIGLAGLFLARRRRAA